MTCASLLCSATETMKFNYRTSHALTSIHDRAPRGKTPARSMNIDWTISLLVMKPGRRPPNVSSDHKSKHYQRARFGQYCIGKNVRVCKCVRGDFSIMKCTLQRGIPIRFYGTNTHLSCLCLTLPRTLGYKAISEAHRGSGGRWPCRSNIPSLLSIV